MALKRPLLFAAFFFGIGLASSLAMDGQQTPLGARLVGSAVGAVVFGLLVVLVERKRSRHG